MQNTKYKKRLLQNPQPMIYDSPRIVEPYKCVVCENQTVVRGFDFEKNDWIYVSKLTKIQIGLHWIFFCPTCLYDLKAEVKRLGR